MLKSYRNLAVASLMGMAAAALMGGGASAAMFPVVQQAVAGATDNELLQDVRHTRRHVVRQWNRKFHGPRYRQRFGSYRHFRNGYYYRSPWWLLSVPLVVGGSYAYGGGYGEAHVEWCLDRYRSYNPRYNTWVSYSGNVNQCVSPYS